MPVEGFGLDITEDEESEVRKERLREMDFCEIKEAAT